MSSPKPFTVQFESRAIRELAKLDKRLSRRSLDSIATLESEPRPVGARTLVGYPGYWRVRVGDYRVVYLIKDSELIVLALRVAHRSGVYRNH